MRINLHALFIALILAVTAHPSFAVAQTPLRVGYFYNFTHAQALAGKASGIFEKKTGASIDWKAFNAGPSAMEALISGAIDIAYVGPNPAINAYLRSGGKALRIIAGAASGGASLVVRKNGGINAATDFKGKRIASPEYGNTQDVALRHWLTSQGMKLNQDVKILTVKNPDILMFFQQGNLDAAWVPEPWVTRLVQEGNGILFLDERKIWPGGKFPTSLLVVRSEFLQQNRALVKHFIEAHVEITDWIIAHPDKAKKSINEELTKLAKKPLPVKVLDEAFNRVAITYDPLPAALATSARHAGELGFLPGGKTSSPDISRIFDLTLINDVLRERRKPLLKQ